MNYNDLHMCCESDLIEIVRDYADAHPNFCTDFIDSLEDALDKYDYLTAAQSDALVKIITKFRMLKK